MGNAVKGLTASQVGVFKILSTCIMRSNHSDSKLRQNNPQQNQNRISIS